MPYCFVIQSFDGGKFDKRYNDVFKPAIEGAGLEPYRVDRDPSVSIPINEIESGIRGASVCFAEITLDNPNVWFELGYALASEKEICLICSEERPSRFPFDIQHRSIIRYTGDSPSDFNSLRDKITARIKAIMGKERKLSAVAIKSPLKEDDGLSQHEMIVLTAIVESVNGPQEAVTRWILKNDLDRLGYNNVALNIGLEKLIRAGMVVASRESDQNGEPYNVYSLAGGGMNWLLANSHRLQLNRQNVTPARPVPSWDAPRGGDLDDEIPF